MVSQKLLTYGATFSRNNLWGQSSSTPGNYGLVTDSKIYDYAVGAPGALLREEFTSYLFQSSAQYYTDNLLNLVASHSVISPSGSTVSQQTMTYDEPSYLTGYGSVTQHGTPLSGIRGNLSTASAWLAPSTFLSSHTNWYDTGEAYQAIDAKGNTSTLGYSQTYAGALATSATNAKNQTSTAVYDFNTGLKTSVTDANSQTTSWTYDNLGRATSVTHPNVFPSTSTHAKTSICYDDVAAQCTSSSPVNATVVTEAVNPSTNIQAESQVDGLGRKSSTRLLSDPDGITYGRTTYDNLGHVYQTWNPTRCNPITQTSCPGEGTWGITTHLYDAISRETTTIPPDGTASSNNVTTVYTGNQTTVTDQLGVSRQSTTDALGRLTQLNEVNMGWITQYQYDTLGNLLCAEQHGGVSGTGCSSAPSNDMTSPWRVRRFTYDSLSRLLTSNNPETGLLTYTYDANGNVLTKTDARNITINYSPSGSPIDALNRVTQKTYSNGEPSISYTYDSTSVTNGIGRRTGMTDAAGSTTWNYDPVGEMTSEVRTTAGITKTIATNYDLMGSPYQIAYPSGSTLQYTTGGAGKTLLATDITHGVNYAQNMHYAPAGALSTGVYGFVSGGFAGITLNDSYNSRLQPLQLQASTSVATLMSLNYNFGLGTNDNGDVQAITNNKNTARNQTFQYDNVSRLISAKSGNWAAAFVYDAWGNYVGTNSTPGLVMPPGPHTASTANNQLQSFAGAYDTAGNLLSDGISSYAFDAESRIKTAAGVTYGYDGDGGRVSKSNGTLYWGNLAESDAAGTLTSEYIFVSGERVARRDVATGNVYYYLTDLLGSSNVVANAGGGIENESDFYPFGSEAPITNFLPSQKFKFTGKERDSESGLDNFGARYYSSNTGRFMSPDWAAKAEPIPYAKLNNPQSLNLYAYAQGNAETLADHDGHLVTPWDAWGGNWGSSGGAMLTSQLTGAMMQAMEYDMAEAQKKPGSSDQKTAPPNPAQQTYGRQADGSYKADPAKVQAAIDAKKPILEAGNPDHKSECVFACKALSQMSGIGTSQWSKGRAALELNDTTDIGLAIATLGSGSYPSEHGNSGIYMGHDSSGGLKIVDQWPNNGPQYDHPNEHVLHTDSPNIAMNAAAYYVIIVRQP